MIDRTDLLERLAPTVQGVLRECGEIAARRGQEAYLVGGLVRDLFLGQSSDDIDVVVVGDGMAVAQAISRRHSGTLQRFHAFQTARVELPEAGKIDFASARSELYPRPADLPQVASGTLDEDLARRDFTINTLALALGPERRGLLVDPFDGVGDMQRRLIRFLHERSFADDPTRLLRAIRFAARLDYEVEERTREGIRQAAQGAYLDELSGDRLRREFAKLLEEQPVDGPRLLASYGLLSSFGPGLRASQPALQRLADIRRSARGGRLGEAIEDLERWPLVLAIAACALDQQARWELVRRLRLSREDRAALLESGEPWGRVREQIREASQPSVICALLDRLGVAPLLVAWALEGEGAVSASLERHLQEWRWVRPMADGRQVEAAGIPPGPEVGKALARLRAAWIDGTVEGGGQETELLRQLARDFPN